MPPEKSFDTSEVVDRAMHAFWARGYEATSVQDLVDRTGVNRGSLYATFGDKRGLFLAALRAYDRNMRAARLADLEAKYPPRDAIRRLLRTFVDPVAQGGDNRGCFLTNSALELAAHDPEVAKIVARSQEQIEAFFARMISKGKERGDIPSHVNTTAVARELLASFIGLIVLSRSRPNKSLLLSIVNGTMRRLG